MRLSLAGMLPPTPTQVVEGLADSPPLTLNSTAPPTSMLVNKILRRNVLNPMSRVKAHLI